MGDEVIRETITPYDEEESTPIEEEDEFEEDSLDNLEFPGDLELDVDGEGEIE